MTLDSRVEKNSRSIIALHALLEKIAHEPAEFAKDETLRKALKSQGALSKLSITDRGICATSLNTVKRISDDVLAGGFEILDRRRIAAMNAIAAHRAEGQCSNKVTKTGLTLRVKEVENRLQQAYQDLWHITMAFEKALVQGRHYAKQSHNPAISALCEREQRELRSMISLCKHPVAMNKSEGRDGAS